MMVSKKIPKVYVSDMALITPLGFSVRQNMEMLKSGVGTIQRYQNIDLLPEPFYASGISELWLERLCQPFGLSGDFTKFEKMVLLMFETIRSSTQIPLASKSTLVLLATAKGNISLLDPENKDTMDVERASLWHTAGMLQEYGELSNRPSIVCNACISGLLAIVMGKRLIEIGRYENVLVIGAEVLSKFVLSGFMALQAMSPLPCKPFDIDRQGLSPGEAAGAMLITRREPPLSTGAKTICISGGASSHDAHHISAPSRTGEGLVNAIKQAILEAGLNDINLLGFISAHGTGTVFNDAMEAFALKRLNLIEIPVHSLKGFWGHTFGAAGLIEAIVSVEALAMDLILPTCGFEQASHDVDLRISKSVGYGKSLLNCLKIASGFGGCNAAVIFSCHKT